MLYNFEGSPDGASPAAGLTYDQHGELYSTTQAGGTGSACRGGCGTVFGSRRNKATARRKASRPRTLELRTTTQALNKHSHLGTLIAKQPPYFLDDTIPSYEIMIATIHYPQDNAAL